MTTTEAIDKINSLPIMRLDEKSELKEALLLAVDALMRKIPVQPTREFLGDHYAFYCGECGRSYVNGVNFCEICGQAIDWSDVSESALDK